MASRPWAALEPLETRGWLAGDYDPRAAARANAAYTDLYAGDLTRSFEHGCIVEMYRTRSGHLAPDSCAKYVHQWRRSVTLEVTST